MKKGLSANVGRIMKKSLQANAKISKEVKETMQECVSEFISFITGEALDKCQREKRKTLNGDDLLWAMTTLGFEDYVELLKVYLHRYREMEGDKTTCSSSSSSASASVGRQTQKDKDAVAGSGSGSGSEELNGMMMMMMGHYQGQVYSSSGFHHMGVAEKPQHYAAGSNGRTR